MTMPSVTNDEQPLAEQFETFSFYTLLSLGLCTITYLGLGIYYRDTGALIIGIGLFALSTLVFLLRRAITPERLDVLSMNMVLGSLAVSTCASFLHPELLSTFAVGNVLLAIVALQFASVRLAQRMIIAACIAISLTFLFAIISPIESKLPAWLTVLLYYGTLLSTCGLVLLLLWQFHGRLNRMLQVLTDTNSELAERQRHLEQMNDHLSAQNEEQRALMELVTSLETPVISLSDGVLLVPLVGHLDTRRADLLTSRLLEEVGRLRTQIVVLDLAGVPLMDTAVAATLSRTVRAVELLGAQVVISGITATIAATMTNLGVTLDNITVVRSPQEALSVDGLQVGRPRTYHRN